MRDSTTRSTIPYSFACSAVNQRSRSPSREIVSGVCPVCSAVIRSMVRLVNSRFSAWIAMSAVEPPMPADGWCIMIRAFGSAHRFPRVPTLSRNCPMLAANPTASVDTSLGMSRMVS